MKIFLLCVLFFEIVISTKHMQENSLREDMRVLIYRIPESEIGFNILVLYLFSPYIDILSDIGSNFYLNECSKGPWR
jgi:hypothetical protein